MKLFRYLGFIVTFIFCVTFTPLTAHCEENIFGFYVYYPEGKDYRETVLTDDEKMSYFIDLCITEWPSEDADTIPITVKSSNSAVITPVLNSFTLDYDNMWFSSTSVEFDIHQIGTADITFSTEHESLTVTVVVLPDSCANVKKITQTNYNTFKIQWEKVEGCSGYLIQRADEDSSEYETIKTINNANATAVSFTGKWEKTYRYRVVPYINYRNQALYYEHIYNKNYMEYGNGSLFTVERPKGQLASVTQKGNNSLVIKWKSVAGAKRYKLYRSEHENGTYKCVFTTKNKTSYTQKVTKGKLYYYYVVTEFSEGWGNPSNRLSGIVTIKGKESANVQKNISQSYQDGKYYGNWAESDRTYYYNQGNNLYMVCVQNDNTLQIYKANSKSQYKPYKKVKLGKYDVWGGFYHGPDGNFYVAVGYNNPNESDKKVVIKVFQYNKKWKKLKTCKIKGDATNYYKGIYEPFRASGCSMSMQGTSLYLATGRTMYIHSDGKHHQSNIGFLINTKKMTYICDSPYSSHSFQQIARFKDGDLYQVDHGDAYPRSIVLTIQSNYETDKKKTIETSLFRLNGATGDNYTGATIGGMEVGETNVLICGTAQPHDYKIRGVSGMDYSYKQNVYVITADRETGKSKLRWLTKYHPKKSDVILSETRMVKITDTRFVILYSTTENGKDTLHYVVVDNKGKKILEKEYKDIYFYANSDPIIHKGYISWVSTQYDYNSYQYVTKHFRLPVIR